MGYSHYYYQSRPFTKVEWSALCEETRRILAAAENKGIQICGWDGQPKTPVVISEKQIAFNGRQELSHETCCFWKAPKNPKWRENEPEYFNFCKTAHKPYDEAVVSVFVAAKQIAPDAIRISSDGGEEALVKTLPMIKRDKNPIYIWEYNEDPPMAALLEQARNYPKFKVWELKHGGTFTAVTFAATAKIAKKRFNDCFETDEVEKIWV